MKKHSKLKKKSKSLPQAKKASKKASSTRKVQVAQGTGKESLPSKESKHTMSERIALIKRAFASKKKGPNISDVNPPSDVEPMKWLNFRAFSNTPPPFRDFANYIEWPDKK